MAITRKALEARLRNVCKAHAFIYLPERGQGGLRLDYTSKGQDPGYLLLETIKGGGYIHQTDRLTAREMYWFLLGLLRAYEWREKEPAWTWGP